MIEEYLDILIPFAALLLGLWAREIYLRFAKNPDGATADSIMDAAGDLRDAAQAKVRRSKARQANEDRTTRTGGKTYVLLLLLVTLGLSGCTALSLSDAARAAKEVFSGPAATKPVYMRITLDEGGATLILDSVQYRCEYGDDIEPRCGRGLVWFSPASPRNIRLEVTPAEAED